MKRYLRGMRARRALLVPLLAAVLASALLAACRDRAGGSVIAVDGSSTVFPISQAVARRSHLDVAIGISGSAGGFRRLCNGDVAISDASRPITAREREACRARGVELIELPIAFDGIAVVVNPKNDFVDDVTVDELKALWEPAAQGKVLHFSDVRPGWPRERVHLYGAGVDSGTYDYFTRAIVGEEHSSRGDFFSSEDDDALVEGVERDKDALGFFGLAYYWNDKARLKLVAVNGVRASVETVRDATYEPLSRPLFIYVERSAAERPEVQAFVRTYLDQGARIVADVGYVPLPDEGYALAKRRFDRRITGSLFGGTQIGVTIVDLLSAEGR